MVFTLQRYNAKIVRIARNTGAREFPAYIFTKRRPENGFVSERMFVETLSCDISNRTKAAAFNTRVTV